MAAAADALAALAPTWTAAVVLLSYLGYLAFAGAVLPGKLVAGAVLPDSSRLHYRCNGTFPDPRPLYSSAPLTRVLVSPAGLLSLLLLLGLSRLGVYMGWMTPTVSFTSASLSL